ncbi:DNA recombination protein RmuC [Thiomicrorhabdus immobilis]|uniref:DNA recombination protein RmuC n=1 Tax=Thiomicrorhabdus immobilis TaxID=2791037 RepID=A0ABM7MER4_9GAMM|nr:DNA recombination protein RmuC [Thiomicrorhabdus immobilis]BCN93928.1 DNA recombination protein RmuC [Thiomicrorhabdus immobilis]
MIIDISTVTLVALSISVTIILLLSRSIYSKNQRLANQIQISQDLENQLNYQQSQYENLSTSYAKLEVVVQANRLQIDELQAIKGQAEQLTKQQTVLNQQLDEKELALEKLRERLLSSESQLAELQIALQSEKESSSEKIALLESAKKQLADEFKVLANQIFDQKQAQFTQSSQSTIEAVLKPMQGALDAFKSRVELVHKEDLEGRASLKEQLKQLHALNSQMTEEAQNLTQALKGDSKTQGNWGELILERLLERSGLTEGVEFEREKSFTDDHGKRLRPDVIINMPDNKHVVIDSKVSLLHYEQALNADDPSAKSIALKSHLVSLQKHIATLADKRYEHLDQLNAPDFVLMFVPVEGAYLMAIEADSRIFEDAFEKRVAVVTPTTLFTTLKTIEQLWRYERQSENTVKLIKRAAEVHDKFVGFVESFEKVGKQLQTAQTTYEQSHKQMISGQGNLVRQAEMLKNLAGKTKKEIPQHLLNEAELTTEALAELTDD